MQPASKIELPRQLASSLGFWSAMAATVTGVIYFLLLVVIFLKDGATYPPAEAIQVVGGISSLILCPVFVILMASLHHVTPAEKKVLSLSSLAFTLLFAISVSINRYTQLGVVRNSLAAGITGGIDWFLPYGSHSVMFGLEFLGWLPC